MVWMVWMLDGIVRSWFLVVLRMDAKGFEVRLGRWVERKAKWSLEVQQLERGKVGMMLGRMVIEEVVQDSASSGAEKGCGVVAAGAASSSE
jgi:hypothetical protein